MRGTIRKILGDKNFGFITSDNTDFFFHRDDYEGQWHKLVDDVSSRMSGQDVIVDFDCRDTIKGPRAHQVRRIKFGNKI